MWRINVVLPAPRKPVIIVAGIFVTMLGFLVIKLRVF
jgi:hypothetical protein